jgi:Dyp-type peroxidase family
MRDLINLEVQGFVLRGYNMPVARFLFVELIAAQGPEFIGHLVNFITSGKRWDYRKPSSTVNVAFTSKGLENLRLPTATLLSFPAEFLQGMKERAAILGDNGLNSPQNWDSMWTEGRIHAWIGVFAMSTEKLIDRCSELIELMKSSGGGVLVGWQDAASIVIDGKATTKEHFGFTDGFGNPDYLGVERNSQPGQGKLSPDGSWSPLAIGELLLGYQDEAQELPVAPIPAQFAKNGTFMVFRKLHQNIATFRRYLDEHGSRYGGGKEKLAAKMIGRWRDGTPVELSPERPDFAIAQDPNQSTNFTYGNDAVGTRCPIGAHIRRANPRDAFGFSGRLVNRRRITRRSMPYGAFVPEGVAVSDAEEHGMCFIALNASISRQFEFVNRQWIGNGNDAGQGSDKDLLVGNHEAGDSFVVQGDMSKTNPPYLFESIPSFVELRGGDYFFVPSITALRMIATETVNPY